MIITCMFGPPGTESSGRAFVRNSLPKPCSSKRTQLWVMVFGSRALSRSLLQAATGVVQQCPPDALMALAPGARHHTAGCCWVSHPASMPRHLPIYHVEGAKCS